MARNPQWTEEELRILHEMRAQGQPRLAIAHTLGRSLKAVEHKLYDNPIRQVEVRGRQITGKELSWLIRHYKHTTNDEIMRKLRISHSSLHRLAREHGLKKSRQFTQRKQAEATAAAYESHKRNGTFPPKGFHIPKSESNRFQKGQSNRDRLSPKRYREMQEKRKASWRHTYDRDKRRTLAWGFEQRTKFRFVKQSRTKIYYRFKLRKLGYTEDPGDHNLYYYKSEEMRNPYYEQKASEHGVRFQAVNTI